MTTTAPTEAIGSVPVRQLDMPHAIEVTVMTQYGPEPTRVFLSARCAVCSAGLLPAGSRCYLCQGRGLVTTPNGAALLRFLKDFGQ